MKVNKATTSALFLVSELIRCPPKLKLVELCVRLWRRTSTGWLRTGAWSVEGIYSNMGGMYVAV